MRTLLTVLGIGGLAYLIWKETKKPKATDRERPGAISTRATVRPGAKPVKFTAVKRPGALPIKRIIPTAGKTMFGRQTKPVRQIFGARMPKQPVRPTPVRQTFGGTFVPRTSFGLSECAECGSCPPDLARHIRSCPVKAQDASMYRNLLEPTYGFPV